MKKSLSILLAAIFILSLAPVVYGADVPAKAAAATTVAVSAQPAAHPAGPIQKAERGFMNTAFGWTEIPKRIVDKTKESNPIKGFALGLWQGSCKAFARTASGISELVTFPIGRYDKPQVLPDMPAAK